MKKSRRKIGKRRQWKAYLYTGFILCIISIIVMAGMIFFEDMFFSGKLLTEEEYFGVTEDKIALLYNSDLQSAKALYKEGEIYIPLVWYSTVVDDKFYYSDEEQQVILTRANEVINLSFDKQDSQGKELFITSGESVYILLDIIKRYSNISVEDYSHLPIRRININDIWGEHKKAQIKIGTRLYAQEYRGADIVRKLKKGEEVRILDEPTQQEETIKNKKWIKVTTDMGYTGYIRKSKLTGFTSYRVDSDFIEPEYTALQLDQKVVLGWHQVTIADANANFDSLVNNTRGMNVISPTWFSLTDNEGNYQSFANKEYVDKAHELGIQVWPLIENFNKDVNLKVLLSKYENRKKLISRLIADAIEYGFDGVNIDFESLKQEASVHYIQFIRELSVSCRREGLVLSIDVPNYENFNYYYGRNKMGEVADYIINMGYDEHYVGSDKGSVASIGYIKRGIDNTLKEVEASKIINAVPFYTRIWTEGNTLSSKAVGIASAQQWIEENNVKLTWDDDTGQLYGELVTNEGTKYIWMEEEKSLELKIAYMKEKELGGVAVWKLGFEPKYIWDTIRQIRE